MKKLNFNTTIDATPQKVWQTLWNDASYRQWTAVFHEGSYAESDWKEGSKILFLGPGGNGMSSRIARLIPNEFMSFEHLGVVKNGVEDITAPESQGWTGAFENYTLKPTGNSTHLSVEIDLDPEFETMFADIFPKALAIVKELSEQ